jgi:hypothetical protein
MKTLRAILNASAALLLVSTAICGLWLRGQATVAPSSIGFHMTIGLLGMAVWLLALGAGRFVRTASPSEVLSKGR